MLIFPWLFISIRGIIKGNIITNFILHGMSNKSIIVLQQCHEIMVQIKLRSTYFYRRLIHSNSQLICREKFDDRYVTFVLGQRHDFFTCVQIPNFCSTIYKPNQQEYRINYFLLVKLTDKAFFRDQYILIKSMYYYDQQIRSQDIWLLLQICKFWRNDGFDLKKNRSTCLTA